jgi:hypothetical protein
MQLHLPTLLGSTHPEPPVDVGVVCLDGICSSSMLGTVRRHVRPRAVPPSRLDVASWEHGPALRGGAGPQPLVDLLLCQRLRRLAAGGRRLRGRGRGGDDWEGRRGGGRCARGLSGHFLHAYALRAAGRCQTKSQGAIADRVQLHAPLRGRLSRAAVAAHPCRLGLSPRSDHTP